jgi:hypothetical protein
MPSWKFGSEKNDDANSSTSGASYRAGGQPNDESFLKKNKRNVIVTDKGWVRREHRLMNGVEQVLLHVRSMKYSLLLAVKQASPDRMLPQLLAVWDSPIFVKCFLQTQRPMM